jgi:hypothetical protein
VVFACAPAPSALAADASPARPLVAVAYYSADELPTIAKAIEKANFRAGTPIYYGSYWGTSGTKRRRLAKAASLDVPGALRAPIFGWTPNKFWDRRRLSSSEEAKLPGSDRAYDGAAPSLSYLLSKGGSTAYHWGRELGRRFRDRAQDVEEAGDPVSRWQFDEVATNAVHHGGRKARDLMRGMLDGLFYGREELGQRRIRGIVYIANASLELASQPNRGELKGFWETIHRDSIAVAGEEYPRFEGDPRRSAFVQSGGQRAMAAQSGALRKLASKYVVAVTPGYRDVPGLGGNVKGRSHEGVDAWRRDYLNARAQYGVAGYATYNLLAENGSSAALNPLFAAFRDGLRALGGSQ